MRQNLAPRMAANALINPRAAELGTRNAIFWGRGRDRYHVESFPGPLSIKAVIRGEAVWETESGRFHTLAVRLLCVRANLSGERARLPSVRASTREELYRRLLRARQFLDDSGAARLSLAQVARSAALSPFHFHRLFTAVFRQTPHQYVSQKRLQRAARLLYETGMPVTDICLETGFESLGSFSTLFRRRFGMPPSAYRNSKIREARRAVSIAS